MADDPCPLTRSALPSVGASPSMVNPNRPAVISEIGGAFASALWPRKNGLFILTAQSMSNPARGGVELGIHPDDHVSLLQPQPKQGLQTMRLDPQDLDPAASRVRHRPTLLINRMVQLPRCFAGEAQPHHMTRDAGDLGVAMLQKLWWLRNPTRCSSSLANGPVTLIAANDAVRSKIRTSRLQVSAQSRIHISAKPAPPEVNVST